MHGVHGDCSPSDSLVAPMWSFAGRKWPRIPPVGQTPPGKGPAPSTSGEETSVKLLPIRSGWFSAFVGCKSWWGGENLEIRFPRYRVRVTV